MTDQPTSSSDDTQPHDPAAWRSAEQQPTATGETAWPSETSSTPADAPSGASFSPAPEPRGDWAQPPWSDAEPTPERWFEAAAPTVTNPVSAAPRRGTGVGTVMAAALAAAILSSGGTVIALNATGALNRPDRRWWLPARTPNSATVKQPVTIDESSAIIDVANKAGPSVVRITTEGIDPERRHPAAAGRRRLGRDLRQQRLDPDQPSRRRRDDEPDRRAQGRHEVRRQRSTGSTP